MAEPPATVTSIPFRTRIGTPTVNEISTAARSMPPPAVATSFAPSTRRRTGFASSVGTMEP